MRREPPSGWSGILHLNICCFDCTDRRASREDICDGDEGGYNEAHSGEKAKGVLEADQRGMHGGQGGLRVGDAERSGCRFSRRRESW